MRAKIVHEFEGNFLENSCRYRLILKEWKGHCSSTYNHSYLILEYEWDDDPLGNTRWREIDDDEIKLHSYSMLQTIYDLKLKGNDTRDQTKE